MLQGNHRIDAIIRVRLLWQRERPAQSFFWRQLSTHVLEMDVASSLSWNPCRRAVRPDGRFAETSPPCFARCNFAKPDLPASRRSHWPMESSLQNWQARCTTC